MLNNLHIKNFAVIKDAEIELASGMTVITGETGAGKSIIVDTLALIFGGRADQHMIHPAASRTEITATFTPTPEVSAWLEKHELSSNHECIIRRVLTRDGKSKSLINGAPCTQQNVRELGSLLLNIQGQHEYQNLLKPEKQLELLDSFADALSLRDAVQAIYHQYLTAKKAIAALEVMAHDRFTKIDFLRYQLKEIENLHLTENEVPSLHQEHKLLNNAENIITQCEQMLQLAADGENSLSNAIYRITSILEEIKTQDEAITPISELFKHTAINLDEGNRALKNYASKLEINSERLQEIEQRLNLIHNLARKHQIKPEELPQIFVKLKNELNELEQVEDKLKNLKTSLDQLRDSYNQLAQKLTTQRTKAANKLNKLISEKMSALNMPGGKFSVNFIPQSEPTEHGLEALEFQVSANPGHPLQPLAKVASGGELSRISLAIQVAAAQNKITPTLIFDEVDVGIGGKTAEIVGQMLVTLGKITQVICITHLPQVAALGKHHLQVNKHIEKNSTVVALTPLNANERVQEIARMLGGVKITPQTIAHAKEMLVKK